MRRFFQDAVNAFLCLLRIIHDSVFQQFPISADAGQWRLQLMGRIVKKLLADLLFPLEAFDVMLDLLLHLLDRISDLIELLIVERMERQRYVAVLRPTDLIADLLQRPGQ